MDVISIILLVLAVVLAGIALVQARRNKVLIAENHEIILNKEQAEDRLKALTAENRDLALDKARAEERLAVMTEQNEQNDKAMRERFAALAAESLQQNSKSLNEQSRMQIAELLAPMKENLDTFRKAYTDAYRTESDRRAMLDQQLQQLFDVNRRLGDETRRLGEALRGNSGAQGQWGEFVLENVLERSGLVRGQDYFVQETVDSGEGRFRPDIVIRCPGERNIVVDSKASMADYMRMLNAEDRLTLKSAGEAHVASVKKHIAELRRKNYQDLLEGRNADFVMMFIPNEGAYLTAMQLDNTLWQTAFDSRVIIVSPTHLVSVVKLVELMWRQDKQNRNAIEIARLGGQILDKLANFITDMHKISSSLATARRAYDSAMTRLEGRGGIRSIGENMNEKGIKGSRDLPPRTVSEETEPE